MVVIFMTPRINALAEDYSECALMVYRSVFTAKYKDYFLIHFSLSLSLVQCQWRRDISNGYMLTLDRNWSHHYRLSFSTNEVVV